MKNKYVNLSDIAQVIRSKNAGPFEITLDIIFGDKDIYKKVKATGIINKALIAKLYKISEEKIVTFLYYDAANAIKATIVRPKPQGSIGETDMHAAQQHVPLLGIKIPWD